MSTLISSATAGKKAAPKAPPRRRPAAPAAPPPPPPTKAPTPVEESSAEAQSAPSTASPAVLPTPPATQKAPARQSAVTQQVRFAEPVSDHGPPPSPRKAAEPARVPAPTPEQTPQDTASRAAQAPVVRDFATPMEQPGTQQQTVDASQQSPQHEHVPAPVQQAPAPTAVMIPSGQKESSRPAKRTRDESTTPARQRKAPKRSSVRSNATVQEQVEDDGQPGPSTRPRAQSPPVPRRMRLSDQHAFVPSPGPEDDDEEEEELPAVKAKTPAKRKGKNVKSPARVQEELEENAGERAREPDKDHDREAETPAPKPKQPRKPRQKRAPKAKAAEPPVEGNLAERVAAEEGNAEGEEAADDGPDPELHEIDPNTLSMYRMSYQRGYGKTSAREKEMQTIDWDEVARKRKAAAEIPILSSKEKRGQLQLALSQRGENGVVESTEDGGDGTPAAEPEAAETRGVDTGLGFRVVDGEIVMDEDTLTVDRRAEAQAAIADETFIEEVNDLTVRTNRSTGLNDRRRFPEDRVAPWRKSDGWDEELTDKFFEALRCWGTDFMIISRLFPGRTRAAIKKKFNREEKLDPLRINAALLGKATTSSQYTSTPRTHPTNMSLADYATAANLPLSELNKFDGLVHAEELISESMRDKEIAMQAAMEEEAENERQKKVQQEQKAKGAEDKERRKKLAAAKKAARGRGQIYGAGTFGGIGGGEEGDIGGGAVG